MCFSVCTHTFYTCTQNTHWADNEPFAPRGVGDVFGRPSNRGCDWQWLLCPTMCACFPCACVCVCAWIHRKPGSPMMCGMSLSSIPRVTSTWWSASRSSREGGSFDFVLGFFLLMSQTTWCFNVPLNMAPSVENLHTCWYSLNKDLLKQHET